MLGLGLVPDEPDEGDGAEPDEPDAAEEGEFEFDALPVLEPPDTPLDGPTLLVAPLG